MPAPTLTVVALGRSFSILVGTGVTLGTRTALRVGIGATLWKGGGVVGWWGRVVEVLQF